VDVQGLQLRVVVGCRHVGRDAAEWASRWDGQQWLRNDSSAGLLGREHDRPLMERGLASVSLDRRFVGLKVF